MREPIQAAGGSDTADTDVSKNTEGRLGTLVGAGSCTAHTATAIIRVLLLWHLSLISLISIYVAPFLS